MSAGSRVICHDQKKPYDMNVPHGPWWLTLRIPLTRRRHLYIGASTAERFVPENCEGGFASKRLRIAFPRQGESRRSYRDRLSLHIHRWCAHIHSTYIEDAS